MSFIKNHPIEFLVATVEPEDDERHIAGCVCADCSSASLDTDND